METIFGYMFTASADAGGPTTRIPEWIVDGFVKTPNCEIEIICDDVDAVTRVKKAIVSQLVEKHEIERFERDNRKEVGIRFGVNDLRRIHFYVDSPEVRNGCGTPIWIHNS